MHGAMEGGGGVIAKDEPLEEELDILEHPLQPTKPFSLYSVSRGGVNLISQCYGRITDEPFIKISLSALSVSSSQKFHIRLN